MTQESQESLMTKIEASFVDDSAVVQSFSGIECLSSLFEYDVIFTSKNDSIDLDKALKSSITIHIKTESHERFFNGIVAEISQGATSRKDEGYLTEYYVKIRPKLWLLTLDQNYKMFQEKNAVDIIKSVLSDCDISDVLNNIKSCGKEKREYCVQYGESSFNFVSRLMEDEGIFYFFKHEKSKHTLVLADSSSSYNSISGNNKLQFANNIDDTFPLGLIFDTKMKSAVTIGGTTVADYNYKLSETKLYKKMDSKYKGLSFYEYPAGFESTGAGEKISKLRVEQFEFDHSSVVASSTVPELNPGCTFDLQGHHAGKFNASYAVHSVEHEFNAMSEMFIYKNHVRAFKKNIEFRPPRVSIKPRIFGTQSAVVVCPSNQEIYRDKIGCIKVHFHWDRDGKSKDTNDSSCWIRVAQSIAGNGWGALFTPRVGQEVLVAFSEGDPDRPIIIGGAYNDKFLPAYSDKDSMKSSIKTVTFKDNEKGFNELRFYDEKDKEEFYEHAQRDMRVEIENDRYVVLNSKNGTVKDSLTIKKGDKLTELTEGNETITLKKGDLSIILQNGNEEIKLSKGNMKITLEKGNITLDIKGDVKVKCSGDMSLEAQKNINLKAGAKFNIQSGSDTTIKSGTKLTVQASTDIAMKSGTNTKLESSMNFDIKAGMNLTAKATMNASIQATMNMDLKANMQVGITSNLQLSVKANLMLALQGMVMTKIDGTAVNITGTGMTNINSALIRLGGMVKIG